MSRGYKILTTQDRKQVVARYDGTTVTINQLAREYGVHGMTVQRILQAAGVARGKGNRVRRK